MANQIVIEHHFKSIKRVLEENYLLGKCNKIFNTDESGINMDLRQYKAVVSSGSMQAHSQSKGLHDHITVNGTVSAAGTALPPMIIFEKAFPSTLYVKQGPIEVLSIKAIGERILIIDEHGSHMSLNLIYSAIAIKVILYCLPPHTTHLLTYLCVNH